MNKTLEATWAQAESTRHFRWNYAALIGRTIVDVRAMSAEELARLGFSEDHHQPVFLLDDGNMFTPRGAQLLTHRGN
jgi:hypothetical protein